MNIRSIAGYVASALVLPVMMTMSGAAFAESSAPEPSPLKFPSSFGDMQFPEEFPDGTQIEITMQSHFVPAYNEWYDKFAQQWGEANNVDVTVNHIKISALAGSLASAIAGGAGATLYAMVAPPAAFIEGLQPLNDVNKAAAAAFGQRTSVCRHSSYLPAKDMWYGLCYGYAMNPIGYRPSLWEKVGYPDGPSTFADLLKGASEIYQSTGIPGGFGISNATDTVKTIHQIIFSFGGSVQNEKGEVVLDSPETIQAMEWLKELQQEAQTPQVFTWTNAANNQSYIAGRLSFIHNPISWYRTAQSIDAKVLEDNAFIPAIKGPGGKAVVPGNLYYINVLPEYVKDKTKVTAAKKFMLDFVVNSSAMVYKSKLYNFPGFPEMVPQLDAWLNHDPYGSKPVDTLTPLAETAKLTVSFGWPGYANPATSEIRNKRLLIQMAATVARGEKSAKEAVADTTAKIKAIFAEWRARGYIGDGS